jgi:hypothetical protein
MNRADGKHDRERLDELDDRGEKGGEDDGSDVRQMHDVRFDPSGSLTRQ